MINICELGQAVVAADFNKTMVTIKPNFEELYYVIINHNNGSSTEIADVSKEQANSLLNLLKALGE